MMVCRDRDTGPVQPAVCSAAPSAGSIGISFRVMTRIVTSPCLVCTMLTSWSMLLVPLLYHRGGLYGSHTPHPHKVGRGVPLLEVHCFPTDTGVYGRRHGRARRLWCV